MASIILGIMGKKRSGKDTFAARLVSEHGYTRLAFADALKESLLELDPIVDTEMGYRLSAYVGGTDDRPDWEFAKKFDEVRALLQRHGVAMRNHVDSDVWVQALARKTSEIAGPVVITDVRFPNEADWVEDWGGKLVRVHRPGLGAGDTHVSETALDGFEPEYTVVNHSDVAHLHKVADYFADLLAP